MQQSIKLRPWSLDDLDDLVRFANNWQVARFMTDAFPFPYTEAHGRAFIAWAGQDDPVRIFAIEVAGQAVGGIGIHPQGDIHRRNAELGYWLAEPFWGQGIASRAVREAVAFAFDTYAIDRVFARPFGSNAASQRVLEKNHFVLECRLEKVIVKAGELIDECVYAVRRADWQR